MAGDLAAIVGVGGDGNRVGSGRSSGVRCWRMLQVTIALRAGGEARGAGDEKQRDAEELDTTALPQRADSNQSQNSGKENGICQVQSVSAKRATLIHRR